MSPLELPTPQFLDLVHHYMLLVVEDSKSEGAVKSLHEQLNNVLIGDFDGVATVNRTDERGLRMPSWWDESDSAGVTLEQAQATMFGMRRR